jgi:hypothetical protein
MRSTRIGDQTGRRRGEQECGNTHGSAASAEALGLQLTITVLNSKSSKAPTDRLGGLIEMV